MRKGKMEKGITLIALILTIVILLILAIVAINSITNDGLLGKAENVTGTYNNSVINEQGTISGYESFLDKYFGGENNGSGEETPQSLVALFKAGELKVGDYVGYTPSKNEDGSVKTYDPDGGTAGALTGYTDYAQVVKQQDDLKWRVLGLDEANNQLLLISEKPTSNNGKTMLSFYGPVGWNNYEEVLHNTCKNLYSNDRIGATARSMTMDDVDTYFAKFERKGFKHGSAVTNGDEVIDPFSLYEYDITNNTLGEKLEEKKQMVGTFTQNCFWYEITTTMPNYEDLRYAMLVGVESVERN